MKRSTKVVAVAATVAALTAGGGIAFAASRTAPPSQACKSAAANQAAVVDAAWGSYGAGNYGSATMIHYMVADQNALDAMSKAGCPGTMKVRELPSG